MGGVNAGGLFQGLSQGLQLGSALRKHRQQERVADIFTREMEDAEGARQEELSALGGTPSETGLDDPFLYRMADWFKGKKRQKQMIQQTAAVPNASAGAAAPPPGMMSPSSASTMGMPEEGMYRDGGRVRRYALGGFVRPGSMPGGITQQPMQQPMQQQGGGFSGLMQGAIQRMQQPQQQAVPQQAMQRPVQSSGFDQQFAAYREGGEVLTEDEKAKRRAARYQERTPGRVQNATETVTNDTTQKKPSATKPKGKGGIGIDKLGGVTGEESAGRRALRRGKGLLKGTGAGYLAGQTIAGGYGEIDTPTEEYADQLGLPKSAAGRASPLQDIGLRAVGVMGSVGRAIIPDFIEPYLGIGEHRSRQQPAAATPAPTAQPATPPVQAPAGQGGGARTAIARAPAQQPAQQAAAQDPFAGMDFSDADPNEIPDFKTKDWSQHRAMAVRGLVARGVPMAEAFETVDQQVTQMQQRGFTNFAMQGLALDQAGNKKGAMAAYRAAFQYFPSGSDVKFGVKDGQIFGMGVDEETGKPVGQPMPLDPRNVAAMVDNFRKPEAWQHWAKDRYDSQMELKKYEEVDKPLAQAQGDALRTNAQAAMNRSEADIINARSGGGSGAASAMANQRAAEGAFRQAFTETFMIDDPQVSSALASAATQVWQNAGGGMNSFNKVIEIIGRAASIPDPKLRAQVFAQMGISDPMQGQTLEQ